jgi:hypothetical protein
MKTAATDLGDVDVLCIPFCTFYTEDAHRHLSMATDRVA